MKAGLFIFLAACTSSGARKPTANQVVASCLQSDVELTLIPGDLIPGCVNEPVGMKLSVNDMQQLTQLIISIPILADLPIEFDFRDDLGTDSEVTQHSPKPERFVLLSKMGVLIFQDRHGTTLYRVYKELKNCVTHWRLKVCRETVSDRIDPNYGDPDRGLFSTHGAGRWHSGNSGKVEAMPVAGCMAENAKWLLCTAK